MRLSVRQSGSLVKELRFEKGPIYIGRQMHSQVFLPDRAVSRQHAVIFQSDRGDWVLEDLDSANKTFLNRQAIHRNELKDGDMIRVGDFSIKFFVGDEEQQQDRSAHLGDTVAAVRQDLRTVVRKFSVKGAPQVKVPAKRIKHFSSATIAICKTRDINELHRELLDIILAQFGALDAWVALRRDPEGPMEREGGRKVTREHVELKDLVVQQGIADAVGKGNYLLMPELPRHMNLAGVRSAIVSPITRDQKNYGVLYADNSTKHESYELEDLDYLMLLSIHISAVLEKL